MMQDLDKIVFVNSSLGVGGAERVLTTLANAWVEKGREVSIIVLSPSAPVYPIDERIKVQALYLSKPSWHILHGLWMNLRRALTLRRAIVAENAETVLAFGTETNVVTIMATIGLRCRVVVSERCDPAFYPESKVWRGFRRVMYPMADAIVAQTSRAAASLRPWLGDMVGVIPNPVTPPCPISKVQDVHSPFILAAGRLVHQKGFDLLVEAFAHLARDFPRRRLVILGEGEEREPLLAQARALGVSDKLFLPGVVEAPGDYMAQADLFVLPSRFEGFPNVLGEAMASGLPVIAADCPSGPAEIVRNGHDGLLVPPEDVDSLTTAMRQFAEDRGLCQRLGGNARAITERFSLDRVVTAWEGILAPRPSIAPMAGLGGRGASVLAVSMIGVLLAYFSHVVLARLLNVEAYGTYTIVLAVTGVVTLASQLGFDQFLIRMVPVYRHSADMQGLKGLLLAGVVSVLACIMLLSFLAAVPAFLLSMGVGALPLTILVLGLFLVLAQAWGNLLSSVLIGAGRQLLAKSMADAVRPVLFVSAVVILWLVSGNLNVEGVLLANIGAVLVLGGIAGAATWRTLQLSTNSGLRISIGGYRKWLSASVALLLFFLPQSLIINVDVMLLGVYAGADSSGLYWAAARTATLVAFPLYAINTLVAPMISEVFVSKKPLTPLLYKATLYTAPVCLAAFVALLLFGAEIMQIFGPDFVVSVPALYILAGGYALMSLLGPVDFALAMTEHEGKCAIVMFLGAGLNILLNILLIPRFGLEGAAAATAVSLVLARAVLAVLAYRYLDVRLYPFLR